VRTTRACGRQELGSWGHGASGWADFDLDKTIHQEVSSIGRYRWPASRGDGIVGTGLAFTTCTTVRPDFQSRFCTVELTYCENEPYRSDHGGSGRCRDALVTASVAGRLHSCLRLRRAADRSEMPVLGCITCKTAR
jgi:hypothetical protein